MENLYSDRCPVGSRAAELGIPLLRCIETGMHPADAGPQIIENMRERQPITDEELVVALNWLISHKITPPKDWIRGLQELIQQIEGHPIWYYPRHMDDADTAKIRSWACSLMFSVECGDTVASAADKTYCDSACVPQLETGPDEDFIDRAIQWFTQHDQGDLHSGLIKWNEARRAKG